MQNKVDDSKTELLDASSIDRSRKIISLDNNKRFKPTSDIIPHDKKVSILPHLKVVAVHGTPYTSLQIRIVEKIEITVPPYPT